MSALPLPSLKQTVVQHGLNARKSFGQHFLLDSNLCQKIARIPGPLDGMEILEVGPGPGGLTRALLETNARKLVAIEIDSNIWPLLEEIKTHYPDRFSYVKGDALRIDAATLLDSPRHLVANLPYNIATPLLVKWLREAGQWLGMTLMFQREVADRICASPGTKSYGRLGILAQWRCETRMEMVLPPQAFSPPPKVDSAIVTLTPREEQPAPDLFRAMERITAAAFGQRRKMLRSALKALNGETLLAKADIDPARRAETLSIAEFDRLARLLLEQQPPLSNPFFG